MTGLIISLAAGIMLLTGAVAGAVDASTPGWMVFEVPGLAAPDESAASVAFLNPEPAGAHGFIRVSGEHFVDDRGEPLRFYGTNVSGIGCFPEPEVGEKLARRLRQFGMNCLRLHGMDYDHPCYLGKLIWKDPVAGVFSEENMRKLDHFIAALQREGIYVIMNLHCFWSYPIHGTDDYEKNVDVIKQLAYWYPPYVERQKKYARMLFDRVNTVTGVRYADDPTIMTIEMNNEDCIIETTDNRSRSLLAGLPTPLKEEFCRQWTAWLKRRYGDLESLKKAWGAQVGTVIQSGVQGWKMIAIDNSAGELSHNHAGRWHLAVTRLGRHPWSTTMVLDVGKLKQGGQYTVKFRARSSEAKKTRFYIRMDQEPWQQVGMSSEISLEPQWRDFEIGSVIGGSRFNNYDPEKHTLVAVMEYGDAAGDIDIEGFQLISGNRSLLSADEDFDRGIAIPDSKAGGATELDYRLFLEETQTATALDLKNFLRALGCRVPITNTQMPYGGASGQYSGHLVDDYCDCHDYFQHPDEVKDRRIIGRNSAIVADDHGGSLSMASGIRELGKPFFVSESNTPNLNDHGADMMPLNSIMLSIQDWDGLTTYGYAQFVNDFSSEKFEAFLLAWRSNVLVHHPFASLLYRQRRMPSARALSLYLFPVSQRLRYSLQGYSSGDATVYLAGRSNIGAYSSRVAFQFSDQVDKTVLAPGSSDAKPKIDPDGAVVTEDGSFRMYNKDAAGAYATLDLPDAKMLTGHVGGRTFQVGDVTFAIAARPWVNQLPAFSCTTIISLDGLPLAESRKMLLASSGRTEAQNLDINEERTSVTWKHHAGSWGDGPNVSETVEFSVKLPGAPYAMKILDGRGMPTGVVRHSENGQVNVYHHDKSLWFLLER